MYKFLFFLAMFTVSKGSTISKLIKIDDLLLSYDVPSGMWEPTFENEFFSESDPLYLQNGYRMLAKYNYDYNGPFWVGAYGTINVSVLVSRYKENVSKNDFLDYIEKEDNVSLDSYKGDLIYDLKHKEKGIFDSCGTHYPYFLSYAVDPKREYRTIISKYYYLDKEYYLVISLFTKEWISGKEKKWYQKARNTLNLIYESIKICKSE